MYYEINVSKKSKDGYRHFFATAKRSITIIVDDFIATGRTIKSILENIHYHRSNQKVDILCVSGYIPHSLRDEEISHGICTHE